MNFEHAFESDSSAEHKLEQARSELDRLVAKKQAYLERLNQEYLDQLSKVQAYEYENPNYNKTSGIDYDRSVSLSERARLMDEGIREAAGHEVSSVPNIVSQTHLIKYPGKFYDTSRVVKRRNSYSADSGSTWKTGVDVDGLGQAAITQLTEAYQRQGLELDSRQNTIWVQGYFDDDLPEFTHQVYLGDELVGYTVLSGDEKIQEEQKQAEWETRQSQENQQAGVRNSMIRLAHRHLSPTAAKIYDNFFGKSRITVHKSDVGAFLDDTASEGDIEKAFLELIVH